MPNRSRVSWSSTSDPQIYERFIAFVKESRIPKSRLLDEALEDLLVKYKKLSKEEKKTP